MRRYTRPQIRPAIFISLQNGLAAFLSLSLLTADGLRRLLYAHPDSEWLWWLSINANRALMPVMRYLEHYLDTPEKITACLVAGIVVPLIAWRTRYWFATALAGHLALAALIIITLSVFSRDTPSLPFPDVLMALRPSPAGLLFLALSLFTLVMCIADHVAFLRFFVGLFRRRPRPAAPDRPAEDLRGR